MGAGSMSDELLRRAGIRVRVARDASGMTQQQLADHIGITRSSVANLEAGRQDMTISRLAGIALILNLDLASLVTMEELAPAPHIVTVMPVFEVSCRTCGSLVIDITDSRPKAQQSKAEHIAAHAR